MLTMIANHLDKFPLKRPKPDPENTHIAAAREINGEDSTPMLDASAAQRTLKPAIKDLTDDIFGAGTYDKIQSA